MTGFGRGGAVHETFSVTVELKTVNNRFLDVSLRLPSELQQLETSIKRLISGRLSRGRVDVNFQYDRTAEVAYDLNRPLINGYISALRQLQNDFDLSGEPDINVIARLPNVMTPKREEFSAEFVAAVDEAVTIALDDLEKMREAEGRMLGGELESRLAEIESRLVPIAAEAASVPEEYRQKLSKRVADILAKSGAEIELDQGRLAQEVSYIAERADISEEIARLRTHIEHFRSIMSDEKEVGKRLDFLTQELNREANTITSKTNNLTIKENALQIKSEIEKIREQVQNVE